MAKGWFPSKGACPKTDAAAGAFEGRPAGGGVCEDDGEDSPSRVDLALFVGALVLEEERALFLTASATDSTADIVTTFQIFFFFFFFLAISF